MGATPSSKTQEKYDIPHWMVTPKAVVKTSFQMAEIVL
jgi:hypothetical protein